ncbi:hypothetical protein JCM11641_001186 [Rhodosporidiobolus odoratus]
MDTPDDSFSVITSLSYSAAYPSEPFSLLPRHFARLKTAHSTLARELPDCWCARTEVPSDAGLRDELDTEVRSAKDGGHEGDLRIRLSILPTGLPLAEAFPLTPMPSYAIRLVLDDRPTSYDDPFLRNKTSKRGKYDRARERHGATLHPSDLPDAPPFDVILINSYGEITETTISNIAFRFKPSGPYITPHSSCGLLEGVQRADLLEKGEIVEGVVTVQEVRKAVADGICEIVCFNGVRGVFEAYVAEEAKAS